MHIDSNKKRLIWALWLLAISVVLAWIIKGGSLTDFKWYYASGRSWTSGGSCYDFDAYSTALFEGTGHTARRIELYGPQFFAFSVLASLPPFEIAQIVWRVANFAMVMTLIWLTVVLCRSSSRNEPDELFAGLKPFVMVTIAALNPSTRNLVLNGQFTLWIVVMILLGWVLVYDKDKPFLGGALFGIIAVKPHLAAPLLLWLLLDRRWRALAGAVVVPLLFAAYPIYFHGPIELITKWLGAMVNYSSSGGLEVDRIGSPGTTGLATILSTMGIQISVVLAVLVDLAATVLVFVFRKQFDDNRRLALLLALIAALIHGHTYDMLLLLPGLIVLWPSARWSMPKQIAGGVAIVASFIGMRITQTIGATYLHDYGPTLFAATVVGLVVWTGLGSGARSPSIAAASR